jgi:hypothetical protein
MMKTFKRLKESGAAQFEFLRMEALNTSRLAVGVNQDKALNRCLASSGNSHLQGRTLLAKAVRKEHSALMVERILSLANRVTGEKKNGALSKSRSADEALRNRLQLVTVLHEVCPLELNAVKKSAEQLIAKFDNFAQSLKQQRFGCSFVGAIEIEIVSMRMMREAHQHDDLDDLTSGRRKFKVLESMLGRSRSLRNAPTVALVHCHGIIDLGKCSYDDACTRLRQIWGKSYQVQVSILSEQYGGKKKSVTSNLTDIAGYITKGANDRIQDGISLHYKLSFDRDMESIEDQMVQDWRKVGSVIRAENMSDGLEHSRSMTMAEISFHAEAIDMLMGLKRNRMGYVIKF